MPLPPAARLSARRWLLLASALLLVALAVVPAVTAQGGDGDNQDTVDRLSPRRGRQYEPADAPETDFYGPDAQGHGTHAAGHRPALRRREPAAGRPVALRRTATGTTAARRSSTRVRGADARPPPEPRPNPEPRTEGHGSATRRAPTATRTSPTSRRSPTTATSTAATSTTRGPSTRRTDWGDIIPPYDYMDKDGKIQIFPGLQLERGRAGDLQERLQSRPATDAEAGRRRSSSASSRSGGGKFLAHWGYENPNEHHRRAAGRREHIHARRAGSRPADVVRRGPRRGRLPDRVRRLRAHVDADREHADVQRGLDERARRLDHGRQAADPGDRPRPVRPEDRRQSRGRRRGGRATAGRRATIAVAPAATR